MLILTLRYSQKMFWAANGFELCTPDLKQQLTLGVEICNALPDPDVNQIVFRITDTGASEVGCEQFSRAASDGPSVRRLWCRDGTGEAFGGLWRPGTTFRPEQTVVAVLADDILGHLTWKRCLE